MDRNRKKIMEELIQKLEEKNRRKEQDECKTPEANEANTREHDETENKIGVGEPDEQAQVDNDVLYINQELLNNRLNRENKQPDTLKNAIKCIQCQFEVSGGEINFVFYCPQCNEYWLILNEIMGIEGNESSINLSRLGDNVEDESKVGVLQKILADLLPSISTEDVKDETRYETGTREESRASFDREQLNFAISDVIKMLQSKRRESGDLQTARDSPTRQTGFFSIGLQDGTPRLVEKETKKSEIGKKDERKQESSDDALKKVSKRKAEEMNAASIDQEDKSVLQTSEQELPLEKEQTSSTKGKNKKNFYTPISVSDTYLVAQSDGTVISERMRGIAGKDSRMESPEESLMKKESQGPIDQQDIVGRLSKGVGDEEESVRSSIKEKKQKGVSDESVRSASLQSSAMNTISELEDNLKVVTPSEFVPLEGDKSLGNDRTQPGPEEKAEIESRTSTRAKESKSNVSSVEKENKPGEKTFYTDMLSTISQLWSKKSIGKKSPRDKSESGVSKAEKKDVTPSKLGKERSVTASDESRSSVGKPESSGRDKEKLSSQISPATPSISVREVKPPSSVKNVAAEEEKAPADTSKPEAEKSAKTGKSTVSFADTKMVDKSMINGDKTQGTGYAADVENELSPPLRNGSSKEQTVESVDKPKDARPAGKNIVEKSITVSSQENAPEAARKAEEKTGSHNLIDDMRKLVEEEESLKERRKSSDSSLTTQTRTSVDKSPEKTAKSSQINVDLKKTADTEKLRSLEKKLNITNSTLSRHVSSIQDAVEAHEEFITTQEVILGNDTLRQMKSEEEQSRSASEAQKTAESASSAGSLKQETVKSMADSLQVRKRPRSEPEKDENVIETVPTETINARTPTEEVFNDSEIQENVPTDKKSFIDVLKSKIDSNRSLKDADVATESERTVRMSYFENGKSKETSADSKVMAEKMFGSEVSADEKTMQNVGEYNEAEQQLVKESGTGIKSVDNTTLKEKEGTGHGTVLMYESSAAAPSETRERDEKGRTTSMATNYGSNMKSEGSTSRLRSSVIKEIKNLSGSKGSSGRVTSSTPSRSTVKSAKKYEEDVIKSSSSDKREEEESSSPRNSPNKTMRSIEQESVVEKEPKFSQPPSQVSSPKSKPELSERLSSGDIIFPKTPSAKNVEKKEESSSRAAVSPSNTVYSNSNPLALIDTDNKETAEEKSAEKQPSQPASKVKLKTTTDEPTAKERSISSAKSEGVPVELMYEDASMTRESKTKDGVKEERPKEKETKEQEKEVEEKEQKDDKGVKEEIKDGKMKVEAPKKKTAREQLQNETIKEEKGAIDQFKAEKGSATKLGQSLPAKIKKEKPTDQQKSFFSNEERLEQGKIPVSQIKEPIDHSVSPGSQKKLASEHTFEEKQELTHHVSFSDYSSYEIETVEEGTAAQRKDAAEKKVKKKKSRRPSENEYTDITNRESRAASVIIPRYKLKPTHRRKDKHKVKVYLLHSRMTSSDSLSDKSDKADVGDGRVQQLVKFFERIIKKADKKND